MGSGCNMNSIAPIPTMFGTESSMRLNISSVPVWLVPYSICSSGVGHVKLVSSIISHS